MTLHEIKTYTKHYFVDDRQQLQGKYRSWRNGGEPLSIRYYRDNRLHGEFKFYNESGELSTHRFFIDDEIVIDFLETPGLYPKTPEERTYFQLKYGMGGFMQDV